MFSFLVLSILFIASIEGRNLFDGVWQLDRANSIGSSDDFLKLIGVGYFQRMYIAKLDVTEIYEIHDNQTMHFRRETKATEPFDYTFQFGVTTSLEDPIFGRVKQTISYTERSLHATVVQEDRSVFTGLKRILQGDENRITHIMNYTKFDGKKASCVRYMLRKS